MRPLIIPFLCSLHVLAWSQERPISLCRNGGFERVGGWSIYTGGVSSGGNPGKCLRFEDRGSARQDVLAPRPGQTLTAAVDVKVAGVKPAPGQAGYAYAAVYQTDGRGNLVEFRDFAQRTGSHDWRRFGFTFQVHPQARFVSLRCGLFRASGVALFDNWTLVQGSTARRLDEVATTRRRAGKPMAAILREPGMPVVGAASKPETLAAILAKAGIESRFLTADELADPTLLTPARFDVAVLPYGQSFPAAARLSIIHFLRGGGRLLATGGYVFNNLLVRDGHRWRRETDVLAERRGAAMSLEQSLLPNGSFERPFDAPAPEGKIEATWRTNNPACTIVAESPRHGSHCAKVTCTKSDAGITIWMELPVEPRTAYCVSGWIKTRNIKGRGFAYLALYQYGKANKLLKFRDFVQRRGTNDWSRSEYVFTPAPAVERVYVKLGIYLARGEAWFDDVRLNALGDVQTQPMNTATGEPRDGLDTTPAQMGMFDAGFPLKRVAGLRAAAGQHVAPRGVQRPGPLEGWAASGVCGYDHARWVPLLQTCDRYGRPRGAAGAMLLHYRGFYRGSMWTYFGVENVDLFAQTQGPLAETLTAAAKFMVRGAFLHSLKTHERLYRDGERVRAKVAVANQSTRPVNATLRFMLNGRSIQEQPVEVAPESETLVEAEFGFGKDAPDLCEVAALLLERGEPIDAMRTGFVVDRPQVMHSAAESRFAGNYFTRGGRPMFLFGSDTFSYTYKAAQENPLTWSQDHSAAQDVGLNLYENLQYNNNPSYQLDDSSWREFRAMAQLTQKHNLVFMPGMLIGQNVAVGDDALARQSALCEEYAKRFNDVPAYHYYINGDYKAWPKAFPDSLWNEWLKRRYGASAKLKAAWGEAAVKGEWGSLKFPPRNSGKWDDVAAIDKARFECWLTRRWNQAHVAAVRKHDTRHPIMSEYYSSAAGALDIHMTIDGQDVSDFGFFDKPVKDIDALPLKIRWNDLRARGKGVCLGEYGVKTHPAWSLEHGARGYHIMRTEEEQKQLFLAVAHYALGMGASKVQNWRLRDAQTRVFPWGIFYPNQLIPKDVAYVHRNESMIWRFFRPKHVPPALTVCLANNLRLGNDPRLGQEAAHCTFGDLLALHYDFNVIDDHHLDALPAATKAMIYPCAFAMRDDAYAKLLAWVKAGGKLLVTGDVSHDADRQPTRRRRLRELCGVEFVSTNYPNVKREEGRDQQAASLAPSLPRSGWRPGVNARVAGARPLVKTKAGAPVFTAYKLGRGQVHWLADPAELGDSNDAGRIRRAVYAAFLQAASVGPLEVEPNDPLLHVMAQRTETGTVHVIYNTRKEPGEQDVTLHTAAGKVTLHTRNRWPALAMATDAGRLVAVNAYGAASVDGRPVMAGLGLKALLSLDGRDLRESRAILVGPFDAGRLELPPRPGGYVAVVGEFRGGAWTTLERVALPKGAMELAIDADRATCMILICEPAQEARWSATLSEAMTRPERIQGY